MEMSANSWNGNSAGIVVYEVVVQNELSGERRAVQVLCDHPETAQVEALVWQFKAAGWRRCVASPARAMEVALAPFGGCLLAGTRQPESSELPEGPVLPQPRHRLQRGADE